MQLYVERDNISVKSTGDVFVLIKLIKMVALTVDMVGASYFVYFCIFGWERMLVGKYKEIKSRRRRRRRKHDNRNTFHEPDEEGRPLLQGLDVEEEANGDAAVLRLNSHDDADERIPERPPMSPEVECGRVAHPSADYGAVEGLVVNDQL